MDSREIKWLLQEKYQGRITPAAKKDIARFKAGEPLDYLIGSIEFAGSKIDLSQKPLIPRPETEYWTLKVIEEIKKRNSSSLKRDLGTKGLDIFAGSGCVGVAVLKHIPRARIDFAEKEKRLLQQIRLNLKKNNINTKRTRVVESNIFSSIKGKYDYIFANPPYIATTRKHRVQKSVLHYEPHQALFAGKDGLTYIKKFLKEAKDHLKPGGKIYMEFDSPQKREIEQLLKKYTYTHWQFHKDQYQKWRFVVASP